MKLCHTKCSNMPLQLQNACELLRDLVKRKIQIEQVWASALLRAPRICWCCRSADDTLSSEGLQPLCDLSLVISAFPLPLPLHLLWSSHSDLATPQISQVESHLRVSVLAVLFDWNPPCLPNTLPSSDRLCTYLVILQPHQNVLWRHGFCCCCKTRPGK